MLDSVELSSPMRSKYPGEEGMSPSPSDGIISGELYRFLGSAVESGHIWHMRSRRHHLHRPDQWFWAKTGPVGIRGQRRHRERSRDATIADSLVKSVTIQSSEVGVIGTLADAASVRISALVGIGVVSDSTRGTSGGRVACLGRIVLTVATLTGRGDRDRDWTAGVMCSSGRPRV